MPKDCLYARATLKPPQNCALSKARALIQGMHRPESAEPQKLYEAAGNTPSRRMTPSKADALHTEQAEKPLQRRPRAAAHNKQIKQQRSTLA